MFEQLAVTMRRVDFLDPAYAGEPDVRERGVRVEIKPVRTRAEGSIYASDVTTLDPALCRLDFLESAPGAADRMHWHPEMSDDDPGDRSFDKEMPADPQHWLEQFLQTGLRDHLGQRHRDVTRYADDLDKIAATTDEIGRQLAEGLGWARQPWPDVEHDERGMADV
ncbi:MAG: hypothetical protein QOK15_982 [Nocardioidaceae bacterium]|nr:hypothetical protein [Nocardioidaceae bacterium]